MKCYRVRKPAVELRPGRPERAWMDATDQRFAYRCLPLTIANSFGWELILPADVTAEWNGGAGLPDLSVTVDGAAWGNGKLAASHFGHGVLTFHTGYLFRTDPGVGLLVRGAPNWAMGEIHPLEAIVETDWLPFSFTMNWQFINPGRVVFKAGDPFCFVMPVGLHALDAVAPEITDLEDAPDEAACFAEWASGRTDFNARLMRDEPAATEQGWQKWYTRGVYPDGTPSPTRHISKMKLIPPRVRGS